MRILIVSATFLEIQKTLKVFDFSLTSKNSYSIEVGYTKVDVLITGIGMPHTVYNLTKTICSIKYDLVINVGIGGSLSRKLNIGDVVQVESEEFADLGVRSKNSFESLFEMGLVNKNDFPFSNGKLINLQTVYKRNIPFNLFGQGLRKVHGITVNSVNGNKDEIEQLKKKNKAEVESMEGAAVFLVCLHEKVSFLEIRSISNYVEERNKEHWDIPLAINSLNKYCKNILNAL